METNISERTSKLKDDKNKLSIFNAGTLNFSFEQNNEKYKNEFEDIHTWKRWKITFRNKVTDTFVE